MTSNNVSHMITRTNEILINTIFCSEKQLVRGGEFIAHPGV